MYIKNIPKVVKVGKVHFQAGMDHRIHRKKDPDKLDRDVQLTVLGHGIADALILDLEWTVPKDQVERLGKSIGNLFKENKGFFE